MRLEGDYVMDQINGVTKLLAKYIGKEDSEQTNSNTQNKEGELEKYTKNNIVMLKEKE